jgi:hypothetical protein
MLQGDPDQDRKVKERVNEFNEVPWLERAFPSTLAFEKQSQGAFMLQYPMHQQVSSNNMFLY